MAQPPPEFTARPSGPAGPSTIPVAATPTEVARQARSPAELLRRLTDTTDGVTVGTDGAQASAAGAAAANGLGDPSSAAAVAAAASASGDSSKLAEPPATAAEAAGYSNLKLSGRIISASMFLPFKLNHCTGEDWELSRRPGSGALFDAFTYLASPANPWRHTLVGWTGEIEHRPPRVSNGAVGPLDAFPQVDAAGTTVNEHQPPPALPENGVRITAEDRERLELQLHDSKYGRILPVWLTDLIDHPYEDMLLKDQRRWRRYGERVLYPTLHYKQQVPSDGQSEKRYWKDYVRLNQQFADRILAEYAPGDIVWIHDYHLFLLPGILRQMVPNIYIGFYLHSPFPTSELFRCLSKRKDLLTGVLGANMIGFQSFSYSRHFSSCCRRILGFESNHAGIDAYGAHVAIDVFPIGIDVAGVKQIAFQDPETIRTVAAMRSLYAGQKIVIGRDRLDSVRGVTQKLAAFDLLLERYPEWIGKVVLIQVTNPTNVEEQRDESKLSSQMEHLVSAINSRYGSLAFSPVKHYPQYLSPHEYFALLQVADVGLITSVRDGMNTTSLEYVVCQADNHGPLILSEFSGTAASLGNAIHINPWDARGVADAINRALTMPPDQRQAVHHELYRHVVSNPVTTWADKFLKRLLTNLTSFDQSIATPALDRPLLVAQYKTARRRLLMFDYDGTLTPIVKDPQAAIPSDRVLRTLKKLAADPANAVWIISGRDQAFLDEWMGHIPELGLSAEHGCFIRQPNSDTWLNLTEQTDMGWQQEVLDIFQHYSERTQGSFIERKRVALTWHHRRVDPEYAAFQAAECRRLLEDTVARRWPVEVMVGKANLEVRPTFVNKGFIAQRLLDEYKQYHDHDAHAGQPDFVYCLGDDFTDEDMFRTLRTSSLPEERVFAVTVGASSKQTLARWHLLEPSDVIQSLGMLNYA